MKRTSSLVSASVIVLSLTLAGQSFADINLGDLAGLWLFDEGTGNVIKDSSGNGNNGEFQKGPKWVDGKFGKALEFDGTPNYVIVPHHEIFNFGADDFSMGCWMNATNLDAYVVIKRNGGASWWALSASIDRDSGFFIFEGGGVHIDGGKTVIVKKGWHHCVAMRKEGTVYIYVDGEFEVEANIPANMDTPAPIKMGGWGSENLSGGLDEVFIFKTGVTLDEKDIKTIFEKGWKQMFAVSPAGKLATAWGAIKVQ
ncbi:LamG domain-containing protein [Candidatus Poribacteria bacterium]|nr:LamG domain-containing protein [Candidatus Poribacteria bacterium]